MISPTLLSFSQTPNQLVIITASIHLVAALSQARDMHHLIESLQVTC